MPFSQSDSTWLKDFKYYEMGIRFTAEGARTKNHIMKIDIFQNRTFWWTFESPYFDGEKDYYLEYQTPTFSEAKYLKFNQSLPRKHAIHLKENMSVFKKGPNDEKINISFDFPINISFANSLWRVFDKRNYMQYEIHLIKLKGVISMFKFEANYFKYNKSTPHNITVNQQNSTLSTNSKANIKFYDVSVDKNYTAIFYDAKDSENLIGYFFIKKSTNFTECLHDSGAKMKESDESGQYKLIIENASLKNQIIKKFEENNRKVECLLFGSKELVSDNISLQVIGCEKTNPVFNITIENGMTNTIFTFYSNYSLCFDYEQKTISNNLNLNFKNKILSLEKNMS